MAILNFLSLAQNIRYDNGLWEILILKVFDFIANYGWRIIVFTILLKLVLSPLDIFQRAKMRKNQLITKSLEPELEKLKVQYANDPKALQAKQYQLNKQSGYSYFSSCLPAIVTMAVFFYLFAGLNNISQYKNMAQYVKMYDVYTYTYNQEVTAEFGKSDIEFTVVKSGDNSEVEEIEWQDYTIDDWADVVVELKQLPSNITQSMYEEIVANAKVTAQDAVYDAYHGKGEFEGQALQESFLWIKNIWSPDVPWATPILQNKKGTMFTRGFTDSVAKYGTDASKIGLTENQRLVVMGAYDDVTYKLQNSSDNKVNGFLILPILSIGLSFLSQFITTRLQKKSGQETAGTMGGGNMKMMLFMMPIIMGFFALTYTAVFTLYIITNSAMTILLNLGSTGFFKLIDKRQEASRLTDDGVIKYGRPEIQVTKKNNKNQQGSKMKGGRYDATKVGRYIPPEDVEEKDKTSKKK